MNWERSEPWKKVDRNIMTSEKKARRSVAPTTTVTYVDIKITIISALVTAYFPPVSLITTVKYVYNRLPPDDTSVKTWKSLWRVKGAKGEVGYVCYYSWNINYLEMSVHLPAAS